MFILNLVPIVNKKFLPVSFRQDTENLNSDPNRHAEPCAELVSVSFQHLNRINELRDPEFGRSNSIDPELVSGQGSGPGSEG